MPIDRQAAVKKAEKLLTQGRLDEAIQEYVRLIEDQPGDVGAMNTLGDLYVRAGDVERAINQFVRTADDLLTEGFLPKAAALYKKALRLQPDHEHTLSQLAEITTHQELLADAKSYLRRLAERRRLRGDERGVEECSARLRALEPQVPSSAMAIAAKEWSDTAALAAARPAEPPAPVPTVESAGYDPARLLEAARAQLAAGREPEGRAALLRVLMLEPSRHPDVVQLARDLAGAGRVETGFGCAEVACDAALIAGDWNLAIDSLQSLVRVAPHIPALNRLVEVCLDAQLDAPLRAAQAQLADAYLDTGKGAEARTLAAQLLEQGPDSEAHARRLRRAFELLGSTDGERAVHETRARTQQAAIDVMEPEAVLLPGEPYERALEHLAAGRTEAAVADFHDALRVPHTQVKAAAELGRMHLRRGDPRSAVEWLERAADSPAVTQEEAFAVLYDLADALERLGEPARALAILVDLDADAGVFRDVRTRIEQLARSQPGGRHA